MNKKKITTLELVLCGLFTALIAVGAFIKIPIPVVPFTLQVFFTTMAGLLLGAKLGGFSCLAYLILGLVGLPIFTQGGGIGYLLQPTFGYIIGFVFATYLTGKMVEKESTVTFKKLLWASLVGLAVVYVFGMAYYYLISNFVLLTPIGLWPLFLYCFILAVPGDIALCFLCAYLGKRLIPAVKNYIANNRK